MTVGTPFTRFTWRRYGLVALLCVVFAASTLPTSARPAIAAPATGPVAVETQATCDPEGDLTGQLRFGGTTGQVKNRSATCSYTVGIGAYRILDAKLQQTVYDWTIATIKPNSTLQLVVEKPSCAAQIDLFYGDVLFSFSRTQHYGTRLLAARVFSGAYCSRPNCTLTQGYWKNHPEAWQITSMMLGSRLYSKAELLAILNTPVRGNGLVALAHQMIAAKLSFAQGADTPAITRSALAADALINGFVVPPVGSDALPTTTTSDVTGKLDTFNQGMTGPGHCPG